MIKAIWLGLTWLLCATPSLVFAGAWPRGEGKMFVAASAEMTWPDGRALELPDIYGATYLEYGLRPHVTMGLDIGSADITKSERLKAVGFVRYTITQGSSPYQIAVDAGVGTFSGQNVVRFGASYSKGLSIFARDAWVSLDANTLRTTQSAQFASSIDATFGVTLKRGKIIGQISAFQAFDRTRNVSFTPSFAYYLGKGRHLEIGARIGLSGKPDPALKIGIWQEF